MKRHHRFTPTLLSLALFAALGLASCGGDGDSPQPPPPTTTPTSGPTTTPTQEPTPTSAPTPTQEPTPTTAPTPTQEPTPTSAPTPTQEPTPTSAPTPTTVPTPTPTPSHPAPANVWVSYSAEPGRGTQMYNVETGVWMGEGLDNCPDKPVAMDVRPADGMLMGMSLNRRLMIIDTVSGLCQNIPLGPLETAMNSQDVRGFAVNAAGVHAVLLDDGGYGRLVTFKLSSTGLETDLTLWTTSVTAVDNTSIAYAIDFKTGDGASTPQIENNKLIILTRASTGQPLDRSHVLIFDSDGRKTAEERGWYVSGAGALPHTGDIVVQYLHDPQSGTNGDQIYTRGGWTSNAPGRIQQYAYTPTGGMLFYTGSYTYPGGLIHFGTDLYLQGTESLTGALALRHQAP
ncbi:hypothetical protein [Chitiniphilus eburneus]|uniref:hypothetical protein n=1 Tax=Chitiniphilus eburneus TaxID=2571148 RepID=UPI001B7FBA26|nr:hypothetical protein [Chitiniphilus eburneus]